jgi:hypothetical protein
MLILLKYLVSATKQLDNIIFRYKKYYKLLNMWICNKNSDITIEKYLKNNMIKNVAIYGIGDIGVRVFEELKNSPDINIKYFIDKSIVNSKSAIDNINVIPLDERFLDEVDAIIITPIYCFDSIRDQIREICIKVKILSIEEIISDLNYKEISNDKIN